MNPKYRWFPLLLVLVLSIVSGGNNLFAQNHRAVIINGSTPGWGLSEDTLLSTEYWNDTYLMWELLYLNGLPDSNIHVLYNNGLDLQRYLNVPWYANRYNASRYGLDHIVDTMATKSAVESLLVWLADGNPAQGIPAMAENDNLFLYTFGHGLYDSATGHSTLLLYPNSSINDSTLAYYLGRINCAKQVVWMQQCHSGGFIGDLQGPAVCISTAVQFYETANQCDNLPWGPGSENEVIGSHVYEHGEFNYHIMSAAAELRPTGVSMDSADANADYRVSIREAYRWDSLRESEAGTPQFSDISGFGSSFSFANYAILTISNDSQALAYNGNRHMVYKPNTQQFHITYANRKKIWYRYSTDDGDTWGVPLTLGKGEYPCIALSSQGYPCVAWTDDDGGIWFRRHTGTAWSAVYHPYSPTGEQPRLNSAPAMVITPSSRGDTVHLLVTLLNRDQTTNGVAEFAFPITRPQNGYFSYIESQGPTRFNPSLARCAVDTSIHAVWQRADTICYARRGIRQTWTNYGWEFEQAGQQSSYPYIETYGDSIFVVWQHLDSITNLEEIYRAANWRYTIPPQFIWANLSQTSNTASLFGVNASGLATCFVDNTMMFARDVYWKSIPGDPLNNISQSTMVTSLFPQVCLRFNQIADNQLYALWQEGDSLRFALKFKMEYVPDIMNPAYLTSPGGLDQGNPYLVQRDTFFTNWNTAVDVGNNALSYRFPLEPGYAYKVKASIYHEGAGEWKELIRIDTLQAVVSYPAGQVKTLEAWVPPALYENDGCVDVTVNRITGNYAIMGPVYVYRYETGGRPGPGGAMAQNNYNLINPTVVVYPNPFDKRTEVRLSAGVKHNVTIKAYDASGRLIRELSPKSTNTGNFFVWDGTDQNQVPVPRGVYFIHLENLNTGWTKTVKVIKIE